MSKRWMFVAHGVIVWLMTGFFLRASAASVGDILFVDDFNYPNGLITSEYTPTRSAKWYVNSGTFSTFAGAGWTEKPTVRNNSIVFRLLTQQTNFGNVAVSFYLLNQALTSSATTPAVAWDGIHVFIRYQSEEQLYYTSINRRDNRVVIKKKIPGGPSNGGTYYDLCSHVSHTVPYGTWQYVTATIQDNANGSVTLKLYTDHRLLLSTTDYGTGGPPLRGVGRVGIRGDNADLKFENFVVRSLSSTSPVSVVPAITNLSVTTLGATTLLLTCPRFTDGVAQFHRASVLSTSNSAACVWAPLSKPSLAASNKVQFSVSNLAPNTGYQVFV